MRESRGHQIARTWEIKSDRGVCNFLMLGRLSLIRRFASEVPAANRLKLTLVAPHQTFIKEQPIEQVNVSTTEGNLGILAGHVPVILQLKPGLVEVFSEAKKSSYFVSGGFATVNPDSTMQLMAMECVPVSQLDQTAVQNGYNEVQKRLASLANSSEEERAEILIHQEVYQALHHALNTK